MTCLDAVIVVGTSTVRLFYPHAVPNRPSQHATNTAFYRRNRQEEILRVRTRQAATVSFLRSLRDEACADCGGSFEPNQMDFDHRNPTAKSFRLTESSAMLMSRARLLDEVRKCEVVCANCHRVRTQVSNAARSTNAIMAGGSSRYLERKRAAWREHARVLAKLRNVPCADCGRRFPPCAMDFDHRDQRAKTSGVTRMVGRAGVARILAEAAKCDIVCANCHRARTLKRRGDDSRRE
jgi:hypothetical protein